MKPWILLSVLSFASVACALDIREIAFLTAMPVETPPQIDGALDEPFWEGVQPNTNYYQYVNVAPNNPRLVDCPTELRIVYDRSGLYVGVRNWEDCVQKLGRFAQKNYDGSVYWDDCAEIYFDPDATGVGYYKFTVNANGFFDIIWRMDAANQHEAYRLSGVKSAAKVFDDRWEIELFVPWSALHGRAAPQVGDVWMANHCRFRFTHGNFFCTSSPGGSGYTPQKFGYLYFADGQAVAPDRILEIVERKASDNWGIQVGGKTYLHDAVGTRTLDKPLPEVVDELRQKDREREAWALTNIIRLAENPSAPHEPLDLPLAGTYDFSEPDEYDGYNGWFRHNRRKDSYRTPHLEWFDEPVEGSRVFFLTGSNGSWREMIEIADRFGCEALYQPCFFGASGTYADAVTLGRPADKCRQFESILAKNPEVVVFDNVNWDKIPACYRYELLRRVADEGLGLVFPYGIGGKLRVFMNRFARKGERNPMEVTVGRGKIVAGRFDLMGLWTPTWQAEFETRMANMWNLIRKAQVKRETLAEVEFPEGKAPVSVGPETSFLAFRVKNRQADDVRVRVRNAFNEVMEDHCHDLRKGENVLAVDVARLPHGTYFLDIVPRDGDEGDTVVSRRFDKQGRWGGLLIDGTNLSVVAEGQSRSLFCGFANAVGEDVVFEWKLRDLPYRQVRAQGRETVRRGNKGVSVKAPSVFPTLAASLEVKVSMADGTCVADSRKMVFFPNHRFDDYTLLSWDGCEDWGLGALEAPQLIGELGYRNNLGGRSWSSAVWNARPVAQHAHVRVGVKNGKTFWYTFRGFCTGTWGDKAIDALGDEITPNDPVVQKMLEDKYAPYVKSMLPFAPCAWNLGDECSFWYELGRGPKDKPAYVEFLKRKYGTLARYNEVHATNVTDFAVAPHPDHMAAYKSGDWAAWADSCEFAEQTYAQTFQLFRRIVKRIDPLARVGAEGSKSGDLELTVKDLEYWGPYRNLVEDELLRCIAPDTLRGIWWGGYFNNKRDGYPLQMWEYVLTGTLNADMFFAAGPGSTQGMMGGDFTIAPYLLRMLPHLKALRRGLAQLLLHTPFRSDGFAIYFSHPSQRIAKFENRFTLPKASQAELIRFCYRKGYGVNFVTPRRLGELKRHKIVFLSGLNTVSDAEAKAFLDFVRQGGILVADTDVGVLDGFSVPRKENPLRELFGNVLLGNLPDAESRTVSLEKPKVIPYGKGGAIKLGFTLEAARQEAGQAKLDAYLQGILDQRGIQIAESCNGPGGVFRVRQQGDLVLAGFKTVTSGLGKELVVDFGREGWVYECDRGFVGRQSKVVLKALDCPFKLYAQFTSEQTPPAVKLDVTELKPGQAFALDTSVLRKESTYRFEMLDTKGRAIANREEIFVADGKTRSCQMPFSDAPGEYEIVLTDIATGLVGRTKLSLRADR